MELPNPVSDVLYEELKTLAAIRENCALQFRADNGGVVMVETKIKDVFQDDDVAFLVGDNGLNLQLHQLISVNGQPVETFC